MVSPETRLPRRPDHSEASVPGIGADSIRHGGSGTDFGCHVAGTGVCCELSPPETETDRLTCVSLCVTVCVSLVMKSEYVVACGQSLPETDCVSLCVELAVVRSNIRVSSH